MMPISAFAKYITEIDDDAKFGVVSGSYSDYGHELHYAKYDSKTYLVFCAQYGETSPGGGTYEYDEDFKVELTEDRKSYKKICEMITEDSRISVKEMSLVERTIKRDLAAMQKMGVLIREGNTSAGHWVVIQK